MHKTIVCRYDVNSTYIKSIVCRYDIRETEQARISCVLIANQNRAGDTNV